MNLNVLGLGVVALALLGGAAHAATWGASSPAICSGPSPNLHASWSYAGYNFNNDVWAPSGGTCAGAQTIWANSNTRWGVWSDQPNTGGIKSYPHISRTINKAVGSLSKLSTTGSTTLPSSGAWESTFDVWTGNNSHEIMIWLNCTGTPSGCGNVKPISHNWSSTGCALPVYTNVYLSGAYWNVFRGYNGANRVYSFLRTSKTSSTSVDVLSILNYLKNKVYWVGNETVGDVQDGYEVTSSYGGMNFNSSGFTVTAY